MCTEALVDKVQYIYVNIQKEQDYKTTVMRNNIGLTSVFYYNNMIITMELEKRKTYFVLDTVIQLRDSS